MELLNQVKMERAILIKQHRCTDLDRPAPSAPAPPAPRLTFMPDPVASLRNATEDAALGITRDQSYLGIRPGSNGVAPDEA